MIRGSPSTLRQPVPLSEEPFGSSPASPSALSRSLAQAAHDTASQISADPFTPGSYSAPVSPMGRGTPEAPSSFSLSAFQPATTAAFLPSTKSTSGSVTGSTNARYIRRSIASPPPASSSPTSTIGGGFPRSSSSASSILSSSHRRRFSGGNWETRENSPLGLTGEKAQPTLEEQSGSSRWNEMTRELEGEKGNGKGKGREGAPPKTGSMTIGRQSTKGRGIAASASSLFFDHPGSTPEDKTATAAWGASQILSKLQSPP